MNLLIEPELGVPFSADTPYMDLKARAEAACNTAVHLAEHGLDLTPLKEDKDTAASLATEYAENPEAVSKKVTPARMAKMRPASLVMTDGILQEFGHAIVENSVQVRHLVTNKLLLESENPDAKIRLRALELLGKISDVGLFAEKSEITITHQTSDNLRAKLRGKLEKLVNPPAEVAEAVVIDATPIAIDAELGELDPVEYDD
jgi:hypothetical protein